MAERVRKSIFRRLWDFFKNIFGIGRSSFDSDTRSSFENENEQVSSSLEKTINEATANAEKQTSDLSSYNHTEQAEDTNEYETESIDAPQTDSSEIENSDIPEIEK